MIDFNSEFYAAITGAIVGSAVGGLISYHLQNKALQAVKQQALEDRKSVQLSLAYSTFIKLTRLFSNLSTTNAAVQEALQRASTKNIPFGWQPLQPFATLPDHINFSTEEMALLIHLKKIELFNNLVSMDAVHNNFIDMIAVYGAKRESLTQQLKVMAVDGSEFTTFLGMPDSLAFKPAMSELDQLANHIAEALPLNTNTAADLLEQLTSTIRENFGTSLRFELVAPNV